MEGAWWVTSGIHYLLASVELRATSALAREARRDASGPQINYIARYGIPQAGEEEDVLTF
jgi:hypothetical protein